MSTEELRELCKSGEYASFGFPGGGGYGQVVRVGAPADPNTVVIRSVGGTPFRVSARNVTKI